MKLASPLLQLRAHGAELTGSSAGGGCWSLQTGHACFKRSRDRLPGSSTGQLC